MAKEVRQEIVLEVRRLRRDGGSVSAIVPPVICTALGWKPGDRIAWRLEGDVAACQKIDMTQIARIRTSATLKGGV